jgi:hypothetical protein
MNFGLITKKKIQLVLFGSAVKKEITLFTDVIVY